MSMALMAPLSPMKQAPPSTVSPAPKKNPFFHFLRSWVTDGGRGRLDLVQTSKGMGFKNESSAPSVDPLPGISQSQKTASVIGCGFFVPS
jgi:hypothetical protein